MLTPLHQLYTSKLEKTVADMPNKQRLDTKRKMKEDLHKYIDNRLRHQYPTIANATAKRDTDLLAKTVYRAIEEGFVDFLDIDRRDKTRYKAHIGRGKPHIMQAELQDPTPMEDDHYTTSKHPLAKLANKTLRLSRQLATRADRIYTLDNNDNHRNQDKNRRVIKPTTQNLRNHHDNTTEYKEIILVLDTIQNDDYNTKHYPRARLIANRWQEVYQKQKQYYQKAKAELMKQRLNDSKTGPKEITQITKTKGAGPLTALQIIKEGPNGEPPNTWATKPAELDKMLKDAWYPVYSGNVDPNDTHYISNFINEYDQHLITNPPYHIHDMTADELEASCTAASNSAPGMDIWAPADFALLSKLAYQHLATLINLIENGAPWPNGTLHARASFLTKDPPKTSRSHGIQSPTNPTDNLQTMGFNETSTQSTHGSCNGPTPQPSPGSRAGEQRMDGTKRQSS